MTKSHKEIAYSILEALYKHNIPDDADISLEYVKKKINDINVRLIEEQYRAGLSLDGFYQKMCCIEVKCEQTACTVDGIVIPSGDVLWYADIPMLNQKIGNKNIIFLGLMNMEKPFRRMTFSGYTSNAKLDWLKGTEYTIIGNKVYFKHLPTSGIKYICLVGILADPTTSCSWDEEKMYPTPDPYKLELLVKQDILSTFAVLPKDVSQDGTDGTNVMAGQKPPKAE